MTPPPADDVISGSTDRRDDELWVIWSPEHRAWWAPNMRGYVVVQDLEGAGRYSLKKATQIWHESRFDDLPIPLTAARELIAALNEELAQP